MMKGRNFISKKSKPVQKYTITPDGLIIIVSEFNSLSSAAKETGIKVQNLWKVCATEYNSLLGGFYWRFKI